MILFDHPILSFLVLLTGFLVATDGGYRLGKRTLVNEDESDHEQILGLRDSLFVLVSLLIGFTFSISSARYEQRRQRAIDEANAIGTTVLRARLLEEPASVRSRWTSRGTRSSGR